MLCHPVFNVAYVRPAPMTEDPFAPYRVGIRPPPEVDIGQFGEPEWRVDSIVDYRDSKRRGRLFRVRWAGYGPEEDTWEPEGRLRVDIPEMFEQYQLRIGSSIGFRSCNRCSAQEAAFS